MLAKNIGDTFNKIINRYPLNTERLTLKLIDLALLLSTVSLIIFPAVLIPFFHIIFLFLIFGAFYWGTWAFAIRAILLVTITTTAVAISVFAGEIHIWELVEMPLLTLILFLVFSVARKRKQSELERDRLIAELQDTLAQVKTLSGLLPICAACKKIRDDQGYWQQVEVYIREHSEVSFSHGMCPDCFKEWYPGYYPEEELSPQDDTDNQNQVTEE